jgi:hypothetical protein
MNKLAKSEIVSHDEFLRLFSKGMFKAALINTLENL